MKKLTLGKSVETINQSAFRYCDSLNQVLCYAENPPVIAENNVFTCYEQATLLVPAESLEAYQTHDVWGLFSRIVPFIGAGPGDINGDGNVAISDATNLIDMLLGGEVLPVWADVNGDGNVTIADVTVLIDMLLGN